MLETTRLNATRLPEAKPEYSLEDFGKLTPPERFGLAPVKVRIIRRGQPLDVSMPVAILANARNNLQPILEAYLTEFNMNAGVYDAKTNPRGIFSQLPADREKGTIIQNLIFRLLGVNQSNRSSVFGDTAKSYSFLSEAYAEIENEIKSKRESFPFSNPGYFPDIQAHFDEIKKLSGIEPTQIFRKGMAPPVFSWISKTVSINPFLLDKALFMIIMALEEKEEKKKNVTQIAAAHKIPHGTAHRFLKDKSKSPLSDAMFALINERVKVGS